jgi:hypothetical protein
MAARGLVLSGARARLVLDNFAVSEFVPISYRVTFSARMVRVITNPIKLRDGVVIMPRLEDILDAPELTATVEDPKTGTVIANIERVKATRYTQNIGARGIVLTDVEFVAIRVRDESEIV